MICSAFRTRLSALLSVMFLEVVIILHIRIRWPRIAIVPFPDFVAGRNGEHFLPLSNEARVLQGLRKQNGNRPRLGQVLLDTFALSILIAADQLIRLD